MGNSEVGHMNIGAGRVVFQDFTRIGNAIDDGQFFVNAALLRAIEVSRKKRSTLHVMGLLSPGGVHSHETHFMTMVQMAAEQGAHDVRVHAFLDGRDTPPRSASESIHKMQDCLDGYENASFGSLCGRYYAMDRDQRWNRVQLAFETLVNGASQHAAPCAEDGLKAAYERDESDEFVQPTVIGDYAGMRDDDVVIFINFRADRARELTQALTQPGFSGFPCHQPDLAGFVSMTLYRDDLPVNVAFPPEKPENILGEVLARHGLRQLRIAETEKYAHVTFFFNGGEETPFPNEQRVLIPSPDVPTYDMQPQMSVEKLTSDLDSAIRGGAFDVIVCNVANPDMVGHTGSMQAAISAVEAVDQCLGTVVRAVKSAGGELLVTADHGNVEQMTDHLTGQRHTAHTNNPVPFVFMGRQARVSDGGSLRDIAPTMLHLLGIEPPGEMTGHSLVELRGGPTGAN
jgi:2,3-bisphosphoglycerate-independent phosphoglycerate mutase